MRSLRVAVPFAILAAAVSCKTLDDPFPAQATLNFDITDSTVASQLSPPPAPQITTWRAEEASVSDLTGYDGTFSFLTSESCLYTLNALAPASFTAICRSTGLTLAPGPERSAVIRLRISQLERRAGARPDLSAGADPDGDGVPNEQDNCPIVSNPDQKNSNPAQDTILVGDACSQLDSNNVPSIADQDLDGVSDFQDNCRWYPSPAPTGETVPPDSNSNGIGDACERVAAVPLPAGGLVVDCPVTFTPTGSRPSFFRIDFGREGVLTCDAGFSGCALDASNLVAILAASTDTFPCSVVDPARQNTR